MSFDHATQTRRGITLASIALFSAVTLAACAPSPSDPSNAAATAIAGAPETPAPTATPEDPVTDLQAGDVLDEATAKAINEASSFGDDKAYPMPDGTYVFVAADQPVPQNVIDAASATATAAAPSSSNVSSQSEMATLDSEALSAVAAERSKVGKLTIPVLYSMGMTGPDAFAPTWSIGAPGPIGEYPSREEALAAAQAWVDEAPTERFYVVVETLKG